MADIGSGRLRENWMGRTDGGLDAVAEYGFVVSTDHFGGGNGHLLHGADDEPLRDHPKRNGDHGAGPAGSRSFGPAHGAQSTPDFRHGTFFGPIGKRDYHRRPGR